MIYRASRNTNKYKKKGPFKLLYRLRFRSAVNCRMEDETMDNGAGGFGGMGAPPVKRPRGEGFAGVSGGLTDFLERKDEKVPFQCSDLTRPSRYRRTTSS
jgi:hypothetical protein